MGLAGRHASPFFWLALVAAGVGSVSTQFASGSALAVERANLQNYGHAQRAYPGTLTRPENDNFDDTDEPATVTDELGIESANEPATVPTLTEGCAGLEREAEGQALLSGILAAFLLPSSSSRAPSSRTASAADIPAIAASVDGPPFKVDFAALMLCLCQLTLVESEGASVVRGPAYCAQEVCPLLAMNSLPTNPLKFAKLIKTHSSVTSDCDFRLPPLKTFEEIATAIGYMSQCISNLQ